MSPKPWAGEWHPAQALSSCRDVILSKKSSRPRLASLGSTGRPSRASRLDPAIPVKPAARNAAASWVSTSSAAAHKTRAAEREMSVLMIGLSADRMRSDGVTGEWVAVDVLEIRGGDKRAEGVDRQVGDEVNLQLIGLAVTHQVEVVV